ncbi:hypothetical protein D5086_029315 [Populus alba]|uniref:Uncharacterized protein n=1 Tax=Populus alba TaxID=43335 RepID=A0ACC4AT61_POPAL
MAELQGSLLPFHYFQYPAPATRDEYLPLTDKARAPVSRIVRLVKQAGDPYSSGKNLKRAQISSLVKNNIAGNKLPPNSNGIHFVLTAKRSECGEILKSVNSCGFHD